MKEAQDNFSRQAAIYKKYRPTYPQQLYDEILRHVTNRTSCWDCATGNGQVALELSKYFTTVQATDISTAQLKEARPKNNIYYSQGRAEQSSFKADQFDLITVAQAAHWLDVEAFGKEAKRVAKNNGIIAIWGYGLLRINKAIDTLLDEFYYEIVGPYWDPQRKHIDNAYETLDFDFELLNHRKDLNISTVWSLGQLKGYLNSWSSVQHYINKTGKKTPVNKLIKRINSLWDSELNQEVKFPLFLKVGKIRKP